MSCCGRRSFDIKRTLRIVKPKQATIVCKSCNNVRYYKPGDKLVYCSTCKKFIELR